jgi:dipeptidyl aminopeptidase/acylaminoacyl peptidase
MYYISRDRVCTLILIILIACWSLPAAGQDALSIEELIALKRVTSVRMSPAGDRIAYLLMVPRTIYEDDDGPPYHELHVVDLEGNSRPYVTGENDISAMAWSADGTSLFFLAKRNPDAKLNTLYEIALAGGEARELFTHLSEIGNIYPSADGRTLAFTATDAPPEKKEALELKGFKAVVYEESVQPVRVWMLPLPEDRASRDSPLQDAVARDLPGSASDVAWSADGRRYAVALAPTPLVDDAYTSRDVHVVDADSGKVRNALGSVGKLGHFAFSPDGERIAYVGSEDIHDPSSGRLYVASSTGGERRDLVPGYRGHITDFVWQDDVTLRWLGHRGVWTETASASIAGAQAAGTAPTSGPIVRTVHAPAGAGRFVAAAIADTPAHPPEVYLLRDGGSPERLTNSNPMLDERPLARQEAITYKSRDGLELQAILVHPARREPGGNPLVVFVHGGPESHYSNGWMSNYSTPAQVLAADGYAVVYPNYRGSTGRGVEYSKLGQHDYAEEEFNDIVDAKRHLVNEGLADAARVGISGGSYGGYATMWSASALSEEYAAAVAFVGISNQVSKFGTGDIPWEMYYVHSRAWPWDDWMWMLKRSPVYHADKTKTPLLIMGGGADPRVHPSQSLEMYRHVKLRTDTPVRLVIYPDEKHGNENTAARYDYALRLIRWMDHYLKGPGGEPPSYTLDHAAKLPES